MADGFSIPAEFRDQLLRLQRQAGQSLTPEKATQLVQGLLKRGAEGFTDDVAEGVKRMGVVFVNLYALNASGGRWFLVDTGLPGFASAIKAACDGLYDGRPPEAIILTHGHFDHAGNAEALATAWGVPVYAHHLEMPYLTGGSDYAPADPTPGGAICFLSRFFPTSGYDLRDEVNLRELPEDGTIPGLNGWRWLHTPGHSQGHVSLFREYDRLLIAGDALCTMDLDSWPAQFTRKRELSRPATPFTPDWVSAHESVDALAELGPCVVAAGHGLPMKGRLVADELRELAETMTPPPGGRYTGCPAEYDDAGRLAEVPPPAGDPLKPKLTVAAGLAAVGVGVVVWAAMRRRK